MEPVPSDMNCVARSLREPKAFELIFERHFASVHRYLHRRAGRELADELAAETFALASRGARAAGQAAASCRGCTGSLTNALRRRRRGERRQQRTYARTGSDRWADYEDAAAARVDGSPLDPPGLFGLSSGDTVAGLRDAISGGSARHDGKAQLDGRTVERIRWDPPPGCPVPGCTREPVFAYVDPDTFYPIRIESPHAYISVPGRVLQSHVVVRFSTYEYLPRTAANLALTDIRAQHPDATGP